MAKPCMLSCKLSEDYPCLAHADDAVKGVAALAWDQHDARLAVAVHSGGVPQTKLAIFATDDHPLLALRLIGWPQEARARAPPSGVGHSPSTMPAAALDYCVSASLCSMCSCATISTHYLDFAQGGRHPVHGNCRTLLCIPLNIRQRFSMYCMWGPELPIVN